MGLTFLAVHPDRRGFERFETEASDRSGKWFPFDEPLFRRPEGISELLVGTRCIRLERLGDRLIAATVGPRILSYALTNLIGFYG